MNVQLLQGFPAQDFAARDLPGAVSLADDHLLRELHPLRELLTPRPLEHEAAYFPEGPLARDQRPQELGPVPGSVLWRIILSSVFLL